MNSDWTEQDIFDFLEGKMNTEKYLDFENEIQSNADLAKKIEVMRIALMAANIAEQDNMEFQFSVWDKDLDDSTNTEPTKKPFNKLVLLWLLIPLASLIYIFWNNSPDRSDSPVKIKEVIEKNRVENEALLPSNDEKSTKEKNKPEKSSRPIAGLLSSEQRLLLSEEISLSHTSMSRSSGDSKRLENPMWAKLEDARNLVLNSKPNEAIALLESVPVNDAYFPKSLELLGYAHFAKGDCSLAIETFQKSLSRSPENTQIEYGLYLAYKQCPTSQNDVFELLKEKIKGDDKHPFHKKVQ